MEPIEGTITGVINRFLRSDSVFAVILMMVLIGVSAPMYVMPTVLANDSRIVTIYADGNTKTLPTDAATVATALERAEITVNENDLVEPSVDAEITTDTFHINVYRARPVVVVDGDDQKSVTTAYQSPALIAEAAGFKVYPEDLYELERIDDVLTTGTVGLRVNIIRSTPIKLNLYGTQTTIRTHALTVDELLAEQGVTPDEGDTVRPALDEALDTNQEVYVVRVGTDREVVEEVVRFSRREIRDTAQPLGYEKIQTVGQNGLKLVTYQITIENGIVVSRKPVSTVITKQPTEEIVVVGAKYDLAEAFASLRQCESGGNYAINTGNGYYGAYQFDAGTWTSNAPSGWKNVLPHEAPPSVQDQAALNLYNARGWGPWPSCTASLGLR